MRKLFDELKPFQKSEAHDIFTQMLKSDRSLLLIWILTERLHHESNNNQTWKRFLMNQEIFERNLQDGTNIFSPTLDLKEMSKMLSRNPDDLGENHEYQLSVFDFFREAILSQFYSNNHIKSIGAYDMN